MEFTKDELYEIEKAFDYLASQNARAHFEMVSVLSRYSDGENSKKMTEKLIDEALDAFTIMRSISTKAKFLRENNG